MKILRDIVLAALLLPVMAQAQDQVEVGNLPILMGPTLNLNGSLNTVDYHVSGPDRSLGYGSLLGLAADVPLSPDISFYGTLGYYTKSFKDKNTALDVNPNSETDNTADIKFPEGSTLTTSGSFNYLGIGTMVKFSSFLIGLHWGIPMSAEVTNEASAINLPQKHGQYSLQSDISPKTSDLNLLIEARIGGDFLLKAMDAGDLRFTITAAYPITTVKDANIGYLPRLDDNFRLASIQAGVSFLFAL